MQFFKQSYVGRELKRYIVNLSIRTCSDPLLRYLDSIQKSDIALFGLLDIPHTNCTTQDMIRATPD